MLHDPPLIGVNTTRDCVHLTLREVVDYMIGDGPATVGKRLIAQRAGISYRHLLNLLDGKYPDKAIDVLRKLGYEVYESIEVRVDDESDDSAS